MRYRLALDLGSTSLGWATFRLNEHNEPTAIIKAGVRIFSDGRNPKDGSSLAVTRRAARAMRRRRDRLLKRKARMMNSLIKLGFFPTDETERKALEQLNPYELRARGLDEALTPAEFARALFHINQRRGFKSNRKTDKKDNDSGALKTAINTLRQQLDPDGADGKARTVGEFLWRRIKPEQEGEPLRPGLVRARYREQRIQKADGKTKIDKSYDLYIDRTMIEAEFDTLWKKQTELNPSVFTQDARDTLKDCLLHQRPLKPVKPGRCTLEPDEERAPLALPSQQRFRIYQEVNNLRILAGGLQEKSLSLKQRNALVDALEHNSKRSFTQIKKLLKLPGTAQFNLEDAKRTELKGNSTSAILSKADAFGSAWFDLTLQQQDAIVTKLITEESEAGLISWLQKKFDFDEARAEKIANISLADGYGSLSRKALAKILPALQAEVITYDKAVQAAGYDHHSQISHVQRTGEILRELPYYGKYLQRHVGFGTGDPKDLPDRPEKFYGKIANPTVHIGLNQVRVVVNALIKRYGHPTEVIIEVARDLKQSREQRLEEQKRQAENQKRNERLREDAAGILGITPERVKHADIQKLILWEELCFDVADRKCPYSGTPISRHMALSDEVEIEHILPFSQTLDDSLNNKTLATRRANRIKGNRTPWQAREDFERQGWTYESIQQRAERMPKGKRYRFGEDGYEKWLREDKDFLARALNDTRHLSRVAREYLSLVCPTGTRVIPGRMTALLRRKLGLNDILGPDGEKNRNDHRHHAVDACVIGITDQGMLQRFAHSSASAREHHLNRLVDGMPDPWPTYREHVRRAIHNIWVSHKPDHGHETGFADETTYRPPHLDPQGKWRTRGINSNKPNERSADAPMIAIAEPAQSTRHKSELPYKGYVGGSNYCFEITRDGNGKWQGEVLTTFSIYQRIAAAIGDLRKKGLSYETARHQAIEKVLYGKNSASGKPIVMRLVAGDTIAIKEGEDRLILRVVKMRAGRNQITLVGLADANHANRMNEKDPELIQLQDQSATALSKLRARRITISPIGELHDPGFKE